MEQELILLIEAKGFSHRTWSQKLSLFVNDSWSPITCTNYSKSWSLPNMTAARAPAFWALRTWVSREKEVGDRERERGRMLVNALLP